MKLFRRAQGLRPNRLSCQRQSVNMSGLTDIYDGGPGWASDFGYRRWPVFFWRSACQCRRRRRAAPDRPSSHPLEMGDGVSGQNRRQDQLPVERLWSGLAAGEGRHGRFRRFRHAAAAGRTGQGWPWSVPVGHRRRRPCCEYLRDRSRSSAVHQDRAGGYFPGKNQKVG